MWWWKLSGYHVSSPRYFSLSSLVEDQASLYWIGKGLHSQLNLHLRCRCGIFRGLISSRTQVSFFCKPNCFWYWMFTQQDNLWDLNFVLRHMLTITMWQTQGSMASGGLLDSTFRRRSTSVGASLLSPYSLLSSLLKTLGSGSFPTLPPLPPLPSVGQGGPSLHKRGTLKPQTLGDRRQCQGARIRAGGCVHQVSTRPSHCWDEWSGDSLSFITTIRIVFSVFTPSNFIT